MIAIQDKIVAVSLVQIWWVAAWGIIYFAVNSVASGNKLIEVFIYAGLISFVYMFVAYNPQYLEIL